MHIEIEIDPHYVECVPDIRIGTNNDSVVIHAVDSRTHSVELHTAAQDIVCVEFLNKSTAENNWFEIKKIKFDGIDMQHFIFHGKFYPVYNPEWAAEQHPAPPEFYCPGTQLNHAGTWKMPVRLPIFKTLLDFWTNDER